MADTPDSPEDMLRSLIERFDPAEQKRIRAIRAAVRKRLPTSNELVYDYKTFFVIAYAPNEQPTDGVLSIAARPDGMRLYLMHGPQLPDPKRLLNGSGKQARYLRLESAKDLKHPDVEALIAAAVKMADVPLPTQGRGGLFIRTFNGKQIPRRKPPK